ncbi:MAG: hypothetical protein PVF69_06975, partial [Gemmatimonadota bacterium]
MVAVVSNRYPATPRAILEPTTPDEDTLRLSLATRRRCRLRFPAGQRADPAGSGTRRGPEPGTR